MRLGHRNIATAMTLLLVGCAPGVTPGPGSGTAPVVPAPKASPAAKKPANPFGIPRSVGVPLPASLKAIAGPGADGVRLIGQDGANLVSDSGTGLIGQDGSNLIGQDGSNLMSDSGAGLLGNNTSKLVSDSGNRYRIAQTTDDPVVRQLLAINTLALVEPTLLVDTLLDMVIKAAIAGQVVVGKPLTLPNDQKPGEFLTLQLDVREDHALISIWRGKTADPAKQLVGIRCTSPRKGRAVIFGTDDRKPDSRFRVALDFDKDAGRIVADALIDTPTGDAEEHPGRMRGHWEYDFPKPKTADDAAFKLRATMNVNKPMETGSPTSHWFAGNFTEKNGGAYWISLANADTKGTRIFFPADGKSFSIAPPPPHAVYVDGAGKLVATADAGPLAKLLPPDDEAVPDALADPGKPTDPDPFPGATGLDFPD